MINEEIEGNEKFSLKEQRQFIEFQSKDEYLQAMVEDLSDWLNYLYYLEDEDQLTSDNFFRLLKNGVILCKHAQVVQSLAESYIKSLNIKDRRLPIKIGNRHLTVPFLPPTCTIVDFSKKVFSFHERDNVSNFITWCKNLNIPENLTFESEDLVRNKNQRNVVIALLEVSRIGKLFGMEVPDLIQLEQEIEDEINGIGNIINVTDIIDGTVLKVKEKTTEKSINEIIHQNDIINNNVNNIESNSHPSENEYTSEKLNNTQADKRQNFNNISKNRIEDIMQVKPFKKNNFKINTKRLSSSLGKNESCNYKNHNIPVNVSDHGLFNKVCNDTDPNNILNSQSTVESFDLSVSLQNNSKRKVLKKCRSVFLTDNKPMSSMILDSSDNDSNFSQISRSDFKIPKHYTVKPVGRVKLYDHFNKLNIKKEKKNREKVDLRSLDERVREILSQCQCIEMFLMKKVSEGKYQYGDNGTSIFVRILRTHVMVRIGGGWETLGDFFQKHDPCRKDKNSHKIYLPVLNKKEQKEISNEEKTSSTNFNSQQQIGKTEASTIKSQPPSYNEIESEILKTENNESKFNCENKTSNDSADCSKTQLQVKKLSEVIKPSEMDNEVYISSKIHNYITFSDNIVEKNPIIKEPLPIRCNRKALPFKLDKNDIKKNDIKKPIIISDKFEINKNVPKSSKSTFLKNK